MGMAFGKITVETAKYEVIKSTNEYEIRNYEPSVIAQVTYDPSQYKGDKDGGFTLLANYIGAFREPHNAKPEKIAMTAPVLTSQSKGEASVTMQFLLPAKYRSSSEAPAPVDARVEITEEGRRTYGVVTFSGSAGEETVKEKAAGLRASLERDGYEVVGDVLLARYNPPFTLPVFRTNEVMFPIKCQ